MLNISNIRRQQRGLPELNMAPLIDMIFILLIFFLVSTSFVKESGIDVNRPTAATAVVQNQTSVIVAVDKENRVFMEGREIDVRAVRRHVERNIVENPEAAVIVVADKASSTGTVIRVMDGCRMAGAKNVSLAAALPGKEGK